MVQRFPIYFYPNTCVTFPFTNLLQSGTFVITDEPRLTHHHHPKSIVYIRGHSLCFIFYGFEQINNDMYPFHYSIIQSNFPGLKIVCAPSIHPFLPTTSDLFTDAIVLPSPECQTVGIIQSEALSDWFLSPGDMCLSFLHVFSWLNSLFLLWHWVVLWPPHAKSWLIGKDSDAGRDWGQEEKGTTEDEMAGWHHWLDGCEFEWTPGVGDGQGGLAMRWFLGSPWVRHDWVTELNWIEYSTVKM